MVVAFSLLLLSRIALAGGSSAPLGSPCFVPPADPSNCGVVDVAKTRMQASGEVLREIYGHQSQDDPRQYVRWYMAAAIYVSGCEKTPCASQTLKVARDIGNGWKEYTAVDPYGAPGSCRLSPSFSFGAFNFVSTPAGKDVMTVSESHEHPGHEIVSLTESWACRIPSENEGSSRFLSFSAQGAQIIDYSDTDGTVSNHWALRVPVKKPSEGKVVPTDPHAVRYEWPNGAYVEIGDTGLPVASNFLAPEMFDPASCTTDKLAKYRSHRTPHVVLLHGQKFAASGLEVSRN